MIFNKYYNIFPLCESMRVRSNTPLNDYENRRFAYIIHDIEVNRPKIIRILPYLHARILFLNAAKKNTDYFYTAIETSVEAEKLYNKMLRDRYLQPEGGMEVREEGDESAEEQALANGDKGDRVEKYSAIVYMSITEK